jgi:hypothetical protein
MSLEDLLNVQGTTASKKEPKLAQTAAAVYVIAAEDMARSGVTSIDPRHLDFGEDIAPMVPAEMRRLVYRKLAWQF